MAATLKHEFDRLSVRLDYLFHVDAMMNGDQLPETLKAVIRGDSVSIAQALVHSGFLGSVTRTNPAIIQQAIENRMGGESATFGWLVKARQSEFIIVDNGEVHFSGAPVRTLWIHTPTYEEAVAAALAWAESYHCEKWEGEQYAHGWP